MMRHSAAVVLMGLVAGSLAQSNTSAIALVDAATTTLQSALAADSTAINESATNVINASGVDLITNVADLIFDVSQLNSDLLSFQSTVTSATTSGLGGVVSTATTVTQDDVNTLATDVNNVANSITSLQSIVTLLSSLTNVPQVSEAEINVVQTGVPTAVGPLVDFANQVISGSVSSGLDVSALSAALVALQTAVSSLSAPTVAVPTQDSSPSNATLPAPVSTS